MSLPIHLQSIKSSGVYRFVYDKSVISGQTAETLRLLVGYSDKGPFNTPVYITSRDEFIKTFGNISKRLEKKGMFFHRLALEALNAGPILAMNLKPFTNDNKVNFVSFDAEDAYELELDPTGKIVTQLYDTNRFWTLNAEDLANFSNKYMVITATDNKDASCSIIVRKAVPDEYNLTIREYYAGSNDEMPDYLIPIADTKLNDYFADIYVFKGEFTPSLCGPDGVLGRYFNVTGEPGQEVISLEENYTDAFGEEADALVALANDPASNYIAGYRGTTIPYFKNANGSYVSLDILFNSGYADHKMLMNMDESALDGLDAEALVKKLAIPYIDNSDPEKPDMSNDVIKYYQKGDVAEYTYYKLSEQPGEPTVTYSYEVYATPTAEEKASATSVDTVPAEPTASSPEIIYTTATHAGYVEVANPTNNIKKKAVELTAVPATSTATDPQYIKVTEVSAENNIVPLYIAGFDYTANAAALTVNSCIDVLTGDYGKGLQEALTNRVDVEYHYLVDTFDTSVTNNKTTLAAIAKKKDNCFAILNFPKVNDFKKDPTNFSLNTLDFEKIVKKFLLPDDVDGASWCGYFTQVILSDGTVKTTVPSAGLVSNLFMDKWASRQPYYIVAGSQYGRLLDNNLVGPDYAFSKTDRDVLEPFGINVIVYEPRRGTYINSEQTAKQIPVSALSKIHIRELVIYLQDEIAELLESYRWELNTQVLRDKVKAKADVILETCKNNGGVYDYLNVCDESNNTAEAIDNEFLVLDTHIEPARGAGKMVTQIFIYRTGEMRSSLIQG